MTAGDELLERALLLQCLPLVGLALEIIPELLRRAADEAVAERKLLLAHIGPVDDGLQIAVDLVDDRLRRALRRKEAVPARLVLHVHAGFRERRNVGQELG